MIPEESVAYALAAWKRFDDQVSDGLLRAVSGAFVLVAAADGELVPEESDRFFEVVRSKAEVFSPVDLDDLEKAYSDLSEVMITDPEDGKRLALGCVARVKGIPNHAELVKSAAEIAAAADGQLEAIEESVMQDVRDALGL